jgi:hypothetical protein
MSTQPITPRFAESLRCWPQASCRSRYRAPQPDEHLEETLLEDLVTETLANEQALARKDPMIAVAVVLLILAIVIELVGKL